MHLPQRLCGASPTDLAEYLRQVRPIALLTRAEERELALRLTREGCEEARDRLVCANLRLVVYAAKRYAGLGVPVQDLVEAGNVGLVQAVGRFDPDQGARLSTYAMWWIRRSIVNCLAEHGLIRIPRQQRRAARACQEVARRLASTLGRPATTEEVARDAGVTPAEVRSALRGRAPSVAGGEDGLSCLLSLTDRREAAPEDAVGTNEMLDRARRGLRSLPGREAEIVRLRFGLGGRSALSVADISRELGMPRTQVLKLLDAALSRLGLLLGVHRDERRRVAQPVRAIG
jgi:RNA polymerase primary sigma factor